MGGFFAGEGSPAVDQLLWWLGTFCQWGRGWMGHTLFGAEAGWVTDLTTRPPEPPFCELACWLCTGLVEGAGGSVHLMELC